MASFRVSLLFAATTAPADRVAASPHSGGWSESLFAVESNGASLAKIQRWAQARANLLPTQASIVGYRQEQFTIAGNKLLPGGATTGRFQLPGTSGTLNLPQDALMVSLGVGGSPNTARISLRGIPDGQIANGEYQPDATYKAAMDALFALLTSDGWTFIGRNKSNPTARVNSIAAGVVTLSGNIGGNAHVDYLRLLRVRDDSGDPVKGAFVINNVATNVYTVAGLGATTRTTPSGNARIESLSQFLINTVSVSRAVSRKIGSPFERYRGRASRRR